MVKYYENIQLPQSPLESYRSATDVCTISIYSDDTFETGAEGLEKKKAKTKGHNNHTDKYKCCGDFVLGVVSVRSRQQLLEDDGNHHTSHEAE
mmetsp:Transcript_5508/g.8545  ORF Transcript_5508/g.8545 Transcript_5508/m.8545 type:complete len:93 (-) Transcript_5508:1406-1684(-)